MRQGQTYRHRRTLEVVQDAAARFYPSLFMGGIRSVRLLWGEPECYLTNTGAGEGELHVVLREGWLGVLYDQGLGVLDRRLVLDAEPASAVNVPEGAEAWLVSFMAPDSVRGVATEVACAVRHGGAVHLGERYEQAYRRCIQDHRRALGL